MAAGTYSNADEHGNYFTISMGVGLDPSVGTQAGTSTSIESFAGTSTGGSIGGGPEVGPQVSYTQNSHGYTVSGGGTVSPSPITAQYHEGRTFLLNRQSNKPASPPTPPKSVTCTGPQSFGSVCNM